MTPLMRETIRRAAQHMGGDVAAGEAWIAALVDDAIERAEATRSRCMEPIGNVVRRVVGEAI